MTVYLSVPVGVDGNRAFFGKNLIALSSRFCRRIANPSRRPEQRNAGNFYPEFLLKRLLPDTFRYLLQDCLQNHEPLLKRRPP